MCVFFAKILISAPASAFGKKTPLKGFPVRPKQFLLSPCHPRVVNLQREIFMSLTLVSSGDERALAIRDHLLTVVRAHGRLQMQHGPLRLIVFEAGPWIVNHWTPFNELSTEEASSPGYRHALARQHAHPDLPYGLDVWHAEKVLSILWSDTGLYDIAVFVRGAWEEEALKL
jgi:hypothetical protein